MSKPSIVTSDMIWNELQEIKREVALIKQKHLEVSIEEISLFRATKLLKMGPETIIDLVKSGKLQARSYRDSKRKLRYRFRIADIRKFQEENKYDHLSFHLNESIESSENLLKRIFNNTKSNGNN